MTTIKLSKEVHFLLEIALHAIHKAAHVIHKRLDDESRQRMRRPHFREEKGNCFFVCGEEKSIGRLGSLVAKCFAVYYGREYPHLSLSHAVGNEVLPGQTF